MKHLITIVLLVLSGCADAVHIRDGSQDMLIGDGRTEKGCEVSITSDNTAQVTYTSDGCNITIVPKQ